MAGDYELEGGAMGEALELAGGFDSDQERTAAVVQTSIAISLKRIADALERIDPAAPLNAYGETIGECIQGQHERGLRGIPNP